MTAPFVCVFIAFLLIPLSKVPVSVAQGRVPGGFDNANPRDQYTRLEGWGRRAHATHLNTIEAFPPFAAAVIVAHLAGADPTWSARLAIAFIVARFIYPILYIGNIPTARSSVWGVGLLANVGLFVLPLLK